VPLRSSALLVLPRSGSAADARRTDTGLPPIAQSAL
jgi:hypothetical protein